jgi:single-strand DNA-binding protein
MGTLTRDPEVHYTPKGTAIAELTLAINRVTKTDDGQKKEEMTFVDVVLWGRLAEVAQQYLKKGRPAFVEGRLQVESWDDKQTGQKRHRTRVIGENLQLHGAKPEAEKQPSTQPAPAAAGKAPAAAGASKQQRRDPDLDVEPDDIPFRTKIYKELRESRLNRRVI